VIGTSLKSVARQMNDTKILADADEKALSTAQLDARKIREYRLSLNQPPLSKNLLQQVSKPLTLFVTTGSKQSAKSKHQPIWISLDEVDSLAQTLEKIKVETTAQLIPWTLGGVALTAITLGGYLLISKNNNIHRKITWQCGQRITEIEKWRSAVDKIEVRFCLLQAKYAYNDYVLPAKRFKTSRHETLFLSSKNEVLAVVPKQNFKTTRLGRGGFGEVIVAQRGVLKRSFIDTKLGEVNRLNVAVNEFTIAQELNRNSETSDYVIKLVGDLFVYRNLNNQDKVAFSMERADCSLRDILYRFHYLKNRNERKRLTIKIARLVAPAVAALHALGYAHRDITPRNILVNIGVTDKGISIVDNVKLADFGSSTDSEIGLNIRTTPQSTPPEVFSGRYDPKKVDVFSIGMMLYLFLHGQHPWLKDDYHTDDVRRLSSQFKRTSLFKSRPATGSLEHLIWLMIDEDPKNRCSMEVALSHPILAD